MEDGLQGPCWRVPPASLSRIGVHPDSFAGEWRDPSAYRKEVATVSGDWNQPASPFRACWRILVPFSDASAKLSDLAHMEMDEVRVYRRE